MLIDVHAVTGARLTPDLAGALIALDTGVGETTITASLETLDKLQHALTHLIGELRKRRAEAGKDDVQAVALVETTSVKDLMGEALLMLRGSDKSETRFRLPRSLAIQLANGLTAWSNAKR